MSSPDADQTARPAGATPAQADVADVPQTAVPTSQQRDPAAAQSTHRRGNWRSLVISMVLLSLVVFAFVALVPRPAQRERTTVDVARAASQLAQEKGWPLGVLRTDAGWHPTTVSLTADESGVPTWEVGYHSRPGDAQYVVLAQTRPGDGVSPAAVAAWITRQARQSRVDGRAIVDGQAWERRSVVVPTGAGDRVRRALVARGTAAPGGLVTVLVGEVDYATLETLAGRLDQTAVQPTSTGSSGGSASPSALSSSPSSSS